MDIELVKPLFHELASLLDAYEALAALADGLEYQQTDHPLNRHRALMVILNRRFDTLLVQGVEFGLLE